MEVTFIYNETFYFEIKDLIIQFLAAFDDCVIRRYNENRQPQEKIEVRYVLAPKQRVLYDIVNESHNITLPVVACNITSISRDDTRQFNKIDGFYVPASNEKGRIVRKVPTPTPVNITVSMSIITKYQIDMDQIISNFAPYSNPYIILSWKLPSEAGISYNVELRSEVLWDGNISFSSPTDLNPSTKYNITADTTFTIKGWLFKKLGDTVGTIFVVDSKFYNLKNSTDLYYNSLTGFSFNNNSPVPNSNFTDTVTVSGIPEITNIFISNSGNMPEIFENTTISRTNSGYSLAFYGYNFNLVNYVLLSSTNPNLLPTLTAVNTAKMSTVSGFILSSSDINILTKNVMSVKLPLNIQPGVFNVIIGGSVGYDTTLNAKNIVFNLT